MTAPFGRTTCACQQCISCCKTQPGPLALGDMERIAEFLKMSMAEVKQFFWASKGALVMDMATKQTYQVGSITPRYDTQKKRCVFLSDDDRCTIHAVAPAGCALFDTHMGAWEGQKRAGWLVQQQKTKEYQKLRSELPFAASTNRRRS